jgi:hypothetical protein
MISVAKNTLPENFSRCKITRKTSIKPILFHITGCRSVYQFFNLAFNLYLQLKYLHSIFRFKNINVEMHPFPLIFLAMAGNLMTRREMPMYTTIFLVSNFSTEIDGNLRIQNEINIKIFRYSIYFRAKWKNGTRFHKF